MYLKLPQLKAVCPPPFLHSSPRPDQLRKRPLQTPPIYVERLEGWVETACAETGLPCGGALWASVFPFHGLHLPS